MKAAEHKVRLVPCAIGIRTHSGWAVIVVVSIENGAEHVLERRRIEIIDAAVPGTAQPFHFAERLDIDAAQKHLKSCAETSGRLALKGIGQIAQAVRERQFQVRAAALLLSSGRPLPDLIKILASHALIHTAEGEFFRQAFRTACEELKIPMIGIPERDLEKHATAALGTKARSISHRLGQLGRTLGPPWTQDQKSAALAAVIALAPSLH